MKRFFAVVVVLFSVSYFSFGTSFNLLSGYSTYVNLNSNKTRSFNGPFIGANLIYKIIYGAFYFNYITSEKNVDLGLIQDCYAFNAQLGLNKNYRLNNSLELQLIYGADYRKQIIKTGNKENKNYDTSSIGLFFEPNIKTNIQDNTWLCFGLNTTLYLINESDYDVLSNNTSLCVKPVLSIGFDF